MAVESGIFGHTNSITFILTQNHTFCLRWRRHLQNCLYLLFLHPGSSAVSAAAAGLEASWIIALSIKLIMKPHIQNHRPASHQDSSHPFKTVYSKCLRDAGQRVPVYWFHFNLAGKPICRHPVHEISKQLTKHSAKIQQRCASQYGSSEYGSLSLFICQINSSFPYGYTYFRA